MKAERHALFLLATCLALGVGVVNVVGSAAPTSRSCRSAADNAARWRLLARSSKKTSECTWSIGNYGGKSLLVETCLQRSTYLVYVRARRCTQEPCLRPRNPESSIVMWFRRCAVACCWCPCRCVLNEAMGIEKCMYVPRKVGMSCSLLSCPSVSRLPPSVYMV